MSSNSRLSMGSQSVKLLKTQWDCAEELVCTAGLHLRNANLKMASELCYKALSIIPDFYPAIEMKKEIEEKLKILECEKDASSSDSFDDSESDGASCGGGLTNANAGCTPAAKKKFGGTAFPQQTTSASSRKDEMPTQKSCLKQRPTSAPTAAHSSRGHEQENSGKGLTWAVNPDRPLSERRLKNLLLEGVFFMTTPVELYHRLRYLWHPDAVAYRCPRPSCGLKSNKRLDVVDHFISQHFPESDEGQAVTPFGCKTCKKRFINADLLLSHATIYHPTCHWATPFKEALQREEY